MGKFSSAFATALAWRHLDIHPQCQRGIAETYIFLMSELADTLLGSIQPSIPTGTTLGWVSPASCSGCEHTADRHHVHEPLDPLGMTCNINTWIRLLAVLLTSKLRVWSHPVLHQPSNPLPVAEKKPWSAPHQKGDAAAPGVNKRADPLLLASVPGTSGSLYWAPGNHPCHSRDLHETIARLSSLLVYPTLLSRSPAFCRVTRLCL